MRFVIGEPSQTEEEAPIHAWLKIEYDGALLLKVKGPDVPDCEICRITVDELRPKEGLRLYGILNRDRLRANGFATGLEGRVVGTAG